MKYGIFKRSVFRCGVVVTLSFTPVRDPANQSRQVIIEAENAAAATKQAAVLLKALGPVTHFVPGKARFPDYFVGEFAANLTDCCDTESLLYTIENFTPIPHE